MVRTILLIGLMIHFPLFSQSEYPTVWLKKALKLLAQTTFTPAQTPVVESLPQIIYSKNSSDSVHLAIISTAPSRHGSFPFLVVFNNQGTIKRVWVLNYSEPYGSTVTDKSWLDLFSGKDADLLSQPKYQVDTISGATISSRNLITQVIRLSRTVKEMHGSSRDRQEG